MKPTRKSSLTIASIVVLALAACGSSQRAGGADADAQGGTEVAEDGKAPDAASGWAAVTTLLETRAAPAGVALGLTVWNASDQIVYQHMVGGFTPGTRVAVASASKLVSALVIFDVIRRGLLTLDSSTAEVLGWTGANGTITLRHLLSFTSGLPREAACTLNPLTTLAACVQAIASSTAVAPPGTRFDYGSTHLHVAARMAEVVTGRTWAELFAETLRLPLALPEDVTYVTLPKQAIGRINPLIAGGLRASSDDYAPLLALAFHRGTRGALTIGTPALFEAQTREPFPGVAIGYTPFAGARYGLGSWLLCDQPASGCAVIASPGAFGFTPWLDRAAGYYAILAMELSGVTEDNRPAEFAVQLMRDLQPLIRAQ